MKVTQQEINWVKNEYQAGRSIDEISIDTGKSIKTIKRYLAEAGVKSYAWHKTKEENLMLIYLKAKGIFYLDDLKNTI